MALPEHVQEQRNALVEKVIKDIEAGKPFFWDSEHFGKPAHNMALYNGPKDSDQYWKF